MTFLDYTLYHNLSSTSDRGRGLGPLSGAYEPGDKLVRGWRAQVSIDDPAEPGEALETVFDLHQQDGRPDGQLAPSLSVGDVVVLGESAWSVIRVGWQPVDIDPADIDERPYLTVIRYL